jgi:hypothetical protein
VTNPRSGEFCHFCHHFSRTENHALGRWSRGEDFGLLHLAQHHVAEPIDDATMRDALRIGDYLLAHGLAALTGHNALARRAMSWLARHGERTVTQRDLHRGVVKRGTAEDTEALTKIPQAGSERCARFPSRRLGLDEAHDAPAAALLPNPKALIVGGEGEPSGLLKSAELFNPATNTFEKVAGEALVGRYFPVAVALPNGKVLIAGGIGEGAVALKSAELFNPQNNTFEALVGPTEEMTEAREEPAAALLQDGRVLIASVKPGQR